MQTFICNSSMPRAGSTLLQNILAQHPDITASPTSGLSDIVGKMRECFAMNTSIKAEGQHICEPAFKNMLKSAISGYLKQKGNGKIYIDKSRGWIFHLPVLCDVFENVKILVIVRDLRDIVASMEKKHRNNVYYGDHFADKMSKIDRAKAYLNDLPIFPYIGKLHDALQKDYGRNIYVIKYEELCESPDRIMSAALDFLDFEKYKFDFKHIKQATHENDDIHGIYGDHRINSELKAVSGGYKKILDGASLEMIVNMHKWYFDTFDYKY